MAKPSSQNIASWIEINIKNLEWQPIDKVAIDCIKVVVNAVSDLTIIDWVEEEKENITTLLRDRAAYLVEDGASTIFEIDDNEPPYIRRVNSELTEIVAKLKKIDPFKFEELCSQILQSLGGEAATTKKTGDDGVDFYAFNFDRYASGLPLPRTACLTVIGQAKRYSDINISETDVRKFIGGALYVANSFRKTGKLSVISPVIYAFWTTSNFHESARNYCKHMGVWYMEGNAVAEYVKKLNLLHYLEGIEIN